eukprot:Lankesteria_metandrocarpae@DN4933_c1_g1_i3.p1
MKHSATDAVDVTMVGTPKRRSDATSIQPVDHQAVDNIRCLSANLPQVAVSGHPGAPMGCAPMAHVLWSYVMNGSSKFPEWWNRDRFVLSNGHACALQYVMLHLLGYEDFKLGALKNFRKLNSSTAGHPESAHGGIEVTTGPLGQGIAQAVGLAAASAHLAAKYNRSHFEVFSNYTYVICGDGCLQEGVSSEASSLAGHWGLGKLIVLYDSNNITIDGKTSLSFTEDVRQRYEAYGWHTSEVENGDTDLKGLLAAIECAKAVTDKPSLIKVNTTIGYGSLQQGSEKTHGAPLGYPDIEQCREKFGLSENVWGIEDAVKKHYEDLSKKGHDRYTSWVADVWMPYQANFSNEATELIRRFQNQLPVADVMSLLPEYDDSAPEAATRALSHASLNALAPKLPEIIGGSADLTDSNKSNIKGERDFCVADKAARYFRFGVREHGMAAIINGMFAYGGCRPYAATFLNFIGYSWGAVRIAALSNFGVLHIATHDSIELGEDGPTHQPIELLPLLRSTPNLLAVRPCDGTECAAAYSIWLENTYRPTVMALCRSNIPNIPQTSVEGAKKGAYILSDYDPHRTETAEHKVIIAASGSEVHRAISAKTYLEEGNRNVVVRLVSMPCWELFAEQKKEYRNSVLPPYTRCKAQTNVYVEAASTFGWEKYFNVSVGMETFGASAPRDDLVQHFGLTDQRIAGKIRKHLTSED